MEQPRQCTAFEGSRLIARGALREVALTVKKVIDRRGQASVLIFDDDTAELVEVDLRGTLAEVRARLAAAQATRLERSEAPRGPGRPKLGVVAREVTLLPQHWDWLAAQPGGASVTLRKLVARAQRANQGPDRLRRGREALYRFISALAGDAAGFEEATRALFAGDRARFAGLLDNWPKDVRQHALRMSERAFGTGAGAGKGKTDGKNDGDL